MNIIQVVPNNPETKDAVWLDIAFAVSRRGTCARLRVGCVLVDRYGQVVSTGYNGAPSKMPHCTDVGCQLLDGHCVRSVHAEVNALLQGGRRARGAIAYVTHEPCVRCSAILRQAGVKVVYFEHSYG